ncbi:MAG TPA: carbamoyltransferase HypF [Candidatus Latescibacteria bacterium]|nr:carbamoyltransferase HypF [Candidatus Latescibacterota bacterium]
MTRRWRIRVYGVVQGVGFRPFVYALAGRFGLSGYVRNDPKGVEIEAEGEDDSLEAFLEALREEAPSLSKVERVEVEPLPPAWFRGFAIRESGVEGDRRTLIPPDVATCPECLRELWDPRDRRYRYPFTNCTRCGPRYTIIVDLPYNRPNTTMKKFPMCPDCSREYEDPSDRRFHAQPVACPACGPGLWLLGQERRPLEGEPIGRAAEMLSGGRIVAVKGLGGFHLACDATDEKAVGRLRERKGREAKPFAVMAPDIEAARRLAEVGPEEEKLLTSPRAPIVLLRKRGGLAEGVSPKISTYGIMLPYTPLHHLLLREVGRPLVMTSGNRSGEPICYTDGEALENLKDMADAFLLHNRDIHARCDDSVVRVMAGREVVLRRSRGYVPEPIRLPVRSPVSILACGGFLKNAFCLVQGDQAFPGPHIGDLDNPDAFRAFEDGVKHLGKLLGIRPEAFAHDLHPDYPTTRYALEQDGEKVSVQHHHAHIASVLAEHGLTGPAIGVAFDGTGYGEDGAVWGSEFLLVEGGTCRRVGHIAYVRMPGGERAVLEPWRMAAAHLYQAFGEEFLEWDLAFVPYIGNWRVLRRMLDRGVASPLTSSAGRLFDAVSAVVGVHPGPVAYEGQAAMELEALLQDVEEAYPFEVVREGEMWMVEPGPMWRALVEDIREGVPVPVLSGRFHLGLARAILEVCTKIREEIRVGDVALSGGVFQNARLLERTVFLLERRGFRVYHNQRVPPNDGGICLGQALVATYALKGG